MQGLREAVSFYLRNLVRILVFSIIYVAPLLVTFLVFSTYFVLSDMEDLWGMVGSFILYLILIFVLSLPFVQMVKEEMAEGQVRWRSVIGSVINGFLPVLLTGTIIGVIVAVGISLLVIPGLILIVLLFLFPFSYVYGSSGVTQAIKKAWKTGGRHFLEVFTYILILLFFNQMGNLIGYYSVEFTNEPMAAWLIQVLFYSLLLPFFLIFLAVEYSYFTEENME